MPARAVRPSSDQIIDAAERVFSRTGYGETSLRQLMAEAQISTTAFYARFPSKEAVLAAMVSRFLETLSDRVTGALREAGDLEDGFDRGIHALTQALSEHRSVVRLALTEAPASIVALPALRAAYGMMAELVASKLERLVERGTIDIDDADSLAWALVGALQMQIVRWAVFEDLDDRALEGALRATAGTMLPAILNKRRPR